MSEIVFPPASQTCSSWGASKELELEKCKEDLQGSDTEKLVSASSRIAKVMKPRRLCGPWPAGAWATLGGRALHDAHPPLRSGFPLVQSWAILGVKMACDV